MGGGEHIVELAIGGITASLCNLSDGGVAGLEELLCFAHALLLQPSMRGGSQLFVE